MTSEPTIFASGAALPSWVAGLIDYISAAYPAWKPHVETMAVLYDALCDIDTRWIVAGAKAYVRAEHEFAPSAGQLRSEALKARKLHVEHPPDCDCLPCIQALPASERWLRMSPSMRTMLEQREPETAKALQAASRALKTDAAKQLAAHGVEFSAKPGPGPSPLGDVLRAAK